MRYNPSFFRSSGLIPVLVALAVLALLPLVSSNMYLRHLLVLSFVFGVVASSWDLSLGFGGLFNFAHVALFTVGIYTYGLIGLTLGLSPWLGILMGGVAAGLIAALITLPILRLSGIYIVLVTIAASQVLYQIVISQSNITGGTIGDGQSADARAVRLSVQPQRQDRLLLCGPPDTRRVDDNLARRDSVPLRPRHCRDARS